MSLEALKQELASLDDRHRSEIVAYLVSLGDREDADFGASISRRINDRDPANWMTLEQFDQHLAENASPDKAP